jgi:hypothetical protein
VERLRLPIAELSELEHEVRELVLIAEEPQANHDLAHDLHDIGNVDLPLARVALRERGREH